MDYQEDIAQACRFASFLSIAGCILIIGLYLRFAHLRKHFARLVVYLSISDLWFCFANTIGPYKTRQSGCYVQGLLCSYFGLASILWTGAVAYSLRLVLEDCHAFSERDLEPMYLKVCWGIPAILTAMSMCFVDFQPAGYWCWVDDSAIGEVFRLTNFYLPLWIVISYSMWVYRRLAKRVHHLLDVDGGMQTPTGNSPSEDETVKTDQQRALLRLVLFPMVLVFCWSAATTNRLLTFFWPSFSLYTLNYVAVTTASLQGFLNAILYGSTIAVREAVLDSIHDVVSHARLDIKRWRRRKPLQERSCFAHAFKERDSTDDTPDGLGGERDAGSLEMYEINLEQDQSGHEVTVTRNRTNISKKY